jgi:hypothetical protein
MSRDDAVRATGSTGRGQIAHARSQAATFADQKRHPEAWPVIRAPLPQRDPSQRFVTRHERRDRWGLRGAEGRIAQRRFFSARRNARSRLRGCTSSPNRS